MEWNSPHGNRSLEGLEICEEPIQTLKEYGTVSIAFDITRVLELVPVDHGLSGLLLRERQAEPPRRKDYDLIPGESPADWPKRFDVSGWGVLVARLEGRRIGGAVVAFDTPGVLLLEGRRDLALLWDIRVEPASRGHGVGSALFQAVESWALARDCRRPQSGNAEHQCVGVQILRSPGLSPGFGQPFCLCGNARRNATALV